MRRRHAIRPSSRSFLHRVSRFIVALMAPLPRLFVVLLLCAIAGEGATAQFRRGILAESTEIMLFPAVPPSLMLPAGTYQVDVKNQSTGPARLLSRLDEAITRQLEENDKPLPSATGQHDTTNYAALTARAR